jgi:hypothetical protein
MSVETFDYPQQAAECEQFIAENQPCHVWHHGAKAFVYTGDDMPVYPVPEVDDLQIRLALNQMGLRAAVEAYVAAADQNVKDWWAKARRFLIDNPMIQAAAAALGVTRPQLEALFRLAASL